MKALTPKLQSILADLRREADCEIYIVVVDSETEVAALLVPHGAEGKPCSNPLGMTNALEDFAPPDAGDWARLDQPLVLTIDENVPLLKAKPKLEAVEKESAA